MRAVWLSALFFAAVAAIWAAHVPLSTMAAVRGFGDRSADRAAVAEKIRQAGTGATLALEQGLASGDPAIQLSCARLLALQGDRRGDETLKRALRRFGMDSQDIHGAMAEVYLLSVWEKRSAPRNGLGALSIAADASKAGGTPAVRAGSARASGPGGTEAGSRLRRLDELLEKYPGWSTGYVQRARIHQRQGAGAEARRDALKALFLEPDNFEAMLVLAQAYLLLDVPEQAYICVQQAVRVDPRLRVTAREVIREVLQALDAARARHRREKRRETPLVFHHAGDVSDRIC